MNKLLLSSSNLKEISISNIHQDHVDDDDYLDIIKYVLTSNKYLYNLDICSRNIDKHFFDSISVSEILAEINTLEINEIKHESFLNFINNAYLFKTETIKISNYSEIGTKELINHILKLSNNPFNTVKRVIINYRQNDFFIILSELLNSNKYSIEKLPQIFIENYKKLKIEYSDIDNMYKIDYLFKNSLQKLSFFHYNYKR